MTSILAEMFKHNLWANLRMLDACAKVDDHILDVAIVGTFGTIREMLIHLVGAEEGYGARPLGEAPSSRLPASISVAELREIAVKNGERLIAAAERGNVDRVIEGAWLENGEPFAHPLSTFFIQAINHGTDHRSQIATTLTQQGVEPPEVDGWTYDEHVAGNAPG
ncbi:MAG: DinB family protein [Thermomicrobiales bacterium]